MPGTQEWYYSHSAQVIVVWIVPMLEADVMHDVATGDWSH
jgi:hypothetical protein